MTVTRATPISEKSFSYRGPVSCTRLAVGITTTSAASPPETRTKRSRIRRSFSLFSAPPMGTIQPRVSPSGTLLGIYLSAFHARGHHQFYLTRVLAVCKHPAFLAWPVASLNMRLEIGRIKIHLAEVAIRAALRLVQEMPRGWMAALTARADRPRLNLRTKLD